MWAGDNIIREEAPDKSTDYFYGVNRVSRTVKGDAYTYNATVDGYYDETLGDYVETIVPVNGYHEFYAYDGRGNVVHTMALDSVDLYISPFYGAAAPFPEMDLNCDGEFDLMDLNAASMKYPIVQDYYYSPFGELWQGERATDTNPFRYCGEYHDKETGNIYLRARYYDPSIGRFISVDPIKDGTNWYVYCSNNPIAFVDPSGLESYIFYLSEWKNRTQIQKRELMSMGIPEDEIILIPMDSQEDFENGWNSMGTIKDAEGNLQSVDIEHVIINAHADPAKIGAREGWCMEREEIDNLQEKDVNGNVIILGCNAGHLDYKTNNVASHFAQKVNGALVIASDGTVDQRFRDNDAFDFDKTPIITPYGHYKSKDDDDFERQLQEDRKNVGWIVYRHNGTHVTTRITGSKSKVLTISGACQLNY